LIEIRANAFLQTFDAKLAAVRRLDLDDAVGEKEKEIASLKRGFSRFKRRVWDDSDPAAASLRVRHLATLGWGLPILR